MFKKLKNAIKRLKDLFRAAPVDWKDVWIRSLKTFVEVALTCAITALSGVNFSKDLGGTFWISFLLSAGASGVATVWNGILRPSLSIVFNTPKLDESSLKAAITVIKQNSNAAPKKDDSNG